MYITYDTNQQSLFNYTFAWTKTMENRPYPSWLVRVSDMNIVPVPENAKNIRYCAVSYPWSYSGDIISQESTTYQNQCYDSNCCENDNKNNIISNVRKLKYSDRGEHKLITYSLNSTGKKEVNVKKVKFEDILQQIGKDFGVKYLWYDKMCLKHCSTNKEIYMNEISDIQYRYGAAQFTIALIPEMEIYSTAAMTAADDCNKKSNRVFNTQLEHCLRCLQQSEWCKRMWTYTEAVRSQKILFVGKNVHFSSDHLRMLNTNRRTDDMLSAEVSKRSSLYQIIGYLDEMISFPVSAASLLRHAHIRNSSIEHDKIFALANILNAYEYQIIGYHFDYERPFTEAMIDLYSQLISADLTVMCFGRPRGTYPNTISQYSFLPSWTGATGCHARNIIRSDDTAHWSRAENGVLHIHCSYVTVCPTKIPKTNGSSSNILEKNKEFIFNIEELFELKITHYITQVSSQGKDNQGTQAVYSINSTADKQQQEQNPNVVFMSLVDHDNSKCVQYLVLDIPFDSKRGFACPVVMVDKKNNNHHSIGLCFFTLYDWSFKSLINSPFKFFGTIIKSALKIQ